MTSRTMLAPSHMLNQLQSRRTSAPSLVPSSDRVPTIFAVDKNNGHTLDLATIHPMYPLPLPTFVAEQGAASPSLDNKQLVTLNSVFTNFAAHPLMSNATVVSNALSSASSAVTASEFVPQSVPPPEVVIAKSKPWTKSGYSNKVGVSNRRHSLPMSVMPSSSQRDDAVTHPVPEFLCHLFSMLCDPALSNLISWSVPVEDEPDSLGGGIKGIGKVVVHDPEGLQEEVLGKYYRHSKYASFQRQLNYFGFKKRLHGGKKAKLSPCSYVHEKLGLEPQSLFQLKRRPPASKRAASDAENDPQVDEASHAKKIASAQIKKYRVSVDKGNRRQHVPNQSKKNTASTNWADSSDFPVSNYVNRAYTVDANIQAPHLNRNAALPSNISLEAQAKIFPAPKSIVQPPQSSVAPIAIKDTFTHKVSITTPNLKDDITVLRANVAIREAQRSLERAYLKSKCQHETEEKQKIDLIIPPPMSAVQQMAPNPLAVCMNDGRYINPNSFSATQSNCVMGYTQYPIRPSFFLPGFNTVDCTNIPPSINNGTVVMAHDMTPAANNNELKEPTGDSSVLFDDKLSKLLSTTLPPSEELFDDDMSICSFGAAGMQVINECMLLS